MVSGAHDQDGWRSALADDMGKLETVHCSRHIDVRENRADVLLPLQDLDGFDRGPGFKRREPSRLELLDEVDLRRVRLRRSAEHASSLNTHWCILVSGCLGWPIRDVYYGLLIATDRI